MTEQSDLWNSEFGDDYIDRNRNADIIAANTHLFANVLRDMHETPSSIFEIGANIGLNYEALSLLIPGVKFGAVEVNKKACEELRAKQIQVLEASVEEWTPEQNAWDLTMSKGVLIHLSPNSLLETYVKLGSSSRKWVLICEYFSRQPEQLLYRGKKDALYKRDFAAEFLEANSQFEYFSSGFASRLSPFPQDDLTWFLLKRRS